MRYKRQSFLIFFLVPSFVLALIGFEVLSLGEREVPYTYCSGDRWGSEQSREHCRDLIHTFQKEGFQKALELFSELYERDQEFGSGECHLHAHDLGIALYYMNNKVTMTEDLHSNIYATLPSNASWCVAQLYHGFFYAFMQNERDIDEVLERALVLCKEVQRKLQNSPNAPQFISHCYNGIGYGLAHYYLPTFDKDELALGKHVGSKCLASLPLPYAEYCINGMYEAIMRLYLGTGEEGIKFSVNPENPFWICKNLEPFLKKLCYIGLRAVGTKVVHHDLARAASFIQDIPEYEIAFEVMKSFSSATAGEMLSRGEHEFTNVIVTCQSIAPRLHAPCIEGFAFNLLRFGSMEEAQKRSLTFCQSKNLTTETRKACFSALTRFAKDTYQPQEYERFCAFRNIPYRDLCLKKE